MDILQAIRERRSVRTFDGKPLDDSRRNALADAIAGVENFFGGRVSIKLKTFDLKGGYKPSTYGMVKGAYDFFLIGYGDDLLSALEAGFGFEQVVLRAWQTGLGTCWIAATFNGTVFDRGESWPDGERLRIVSPVGVAASQRPMEKLIRMSMGCKHRKPFGELFFKNDFSTPLESGDGFAEPLEMMRLAPSSRNSQPWRAVVVGDTVHFYYKDKSDLAPVDCGIGLCHFYETEKFYGRAGKFSVESTKPDAPDGLKYLLSYKRL